MKKIISILAILFSISSFAQNDSIVKKDNTVIKCGITKIAYSAALKDTAIFYTKAMNKDGTPNTHAPQTSIAKKNVKSYYIKPIEVKTTVANDTIKYQSQTEQYCEIVATGNITEGKVVISADYGNLSSRWKNREGTTLKEEGIQVAKFTSVIDALNYMNSKGWIVLNSYMVTAGTQNANHYLLKRKV